MIHATYITYVCSKTEAPLGLPQLDLRFFSDGNSWIVNEKPQKLWGSFSRVLSQLS